MLGGFPGNSADKESTCNADHNSIPGLGRSPGEGKGYQLQNSWASLVAQTIKILLQCRRPGLDSWAGKIPWRRERLLPTPVFLPGELHGQRSLAGYCSWSCEKLVKIEQLLLSQERQGNLFRTFL